MIWNAFILCWVAAYVGYPDRINVCQDSVFISKDFTNATLAADIELKHSGAESRKATTVGEQIHASLRRVYLKIMEGAPDVHKNLALQLTIKVTNDTLGPDGLVVFLLVFGCIPRFSPNSWPMLQYEARMRPMQFPRIETADITTELRIQRVIRSQLPFTAHYLIAPGDKDYVHHERDKNWRDPYVVTKNFDKMV